MSENMQVLPLPKVLPIWEHGNKYPDMIRVSMSDGKVITYRIEVPQPHPQCEKAMDLIRMMRSCTYGGYKGKHAKK